MPEDFEWLADGLDDEGPSARQQAMQDARRLLPLYPEALQAVVRRLPHATMDGKLTMIDVLQGTLSRDAHGGAVLLPLLFDPDTRVQQSAALALRWMTADPDVTKGMLNKATDESTVPAVRNAILQSLGPVSDDPDVNELLRKFSKVGDEQQRSVARSSLADDAALRRNVTPAPTVRLALIPDYDERDRALEVLGNLRRVLARLEEDSAAPSQLKDLAAAAIRYCDELGGLLHADFESSAAVRTASVKGRSLFGRIGGLGMATMLSLSLVLKTANEGFTFAKNIENVDSQRLETIRIDVEANCASFERSFEPVIGPDAPLPADAH